MLRELRCILWWHPPSLLVIICPYGGRVGSPHMISLCPLWSLYYFRYTFFHLKINAVVGNLPYCPFEVFQLYTRQHYFRHFRGVHGQKDVLQEPTLFRGTEQFDDANGTSIRGFRRMAVIQIGPTPAVPKSLSPMMKEICSRKHHLDVVIRCDGGALSVHRFFIASQSRVSFKVHL